MLRPTLFLFFGVALFLILGPIPSEGIKCHVCGGSAFSEMVNQEINEVIAASNPDQGVNSNQTVEDEKKKFNSALKNSCGSSGTGTAVDCDLLPSENPEKRLCAKAVSSGNLGRTCVASSIRDAQPCRVAGHTGGTICVCNTDLCNTGDVNTSHSLHQKKCGPLFALGLALLVAYFGFN